MVPIRRVAQSCAAGAAGSKGMVPIRRVNRSCTTKWEGECEEPILIGLPSRPESRCSERDAVRRIRMPLDAPEIGARRGRTRCAEMEVFPSPHGFWAWHDRRDWNCVADFIPLWHDCRDLNLVIAVTFEQSDLVSSLFYNPIHLFSPHPDLTVTDLLRWKGATLLYRLKSSWETQEQALRAPRGSDHTPVSPWAIVTTTILPEFPFTKYPTAARSRPYSNSTYILIPGRHGSPNQPLCSPHGASHHLLRKPRPSECHLGISDGTPLCCLR